MGDDVSRRVVSSGWSTSAPRPVPHHVHIDHVIQLYTAPPVRHPATYDNLYAYSGPISVIMPSVFLCPRRREGGIKRYRDPSVSLFQGAAAIVYRHAGCLQLSHRRPPEMCGLRIRRKSNCHRREAYRLAATWRYLVLFIS